MIPSFAIKLKVSSLLPVQSKMLSPKFFPLLTLLASTPAVAFDYDIVGGGSVVLTDVATQISPLETLFVEEKVAVVADGIEWEANGGNTTTGTLSFETFLDGKLVASGSQSLDDIGRSLPSSVDAGTLSVPKGGRYTIEVFMKVDDTSEASTSGEFEAYGAGVAILPLLVIIVLAVATNMVRPFFTEIRPCSFVALSIMHTHRDLL